MRQRLIGLLLLVCASAAPAAATLPAFTPTNCDSAPYLDVEAGSDFCPWIQQLKTDQVTLGCGGGNYCPKDLVTREELAVVLERAMRGTPTWEVDAGRLDGLDSSAFQRRYAKVATVALDGTGDYGNPLAAIADLATWCGVPTSGNRCQLRIMPGFYEIPLALIIPPWVELVGAGLKVTILYRDGGADPDLSAVVIVHGDGGVRDLAIVTSGLGTAAHAVGLLLDGAGDRLVRQVYVAAYDGTTSSVAIRIIHGSAVDIQDSYVFTGGSASPSTTGIEIAGTPASSVNLRHTFISPFSAEASAACFGVDVSGPSGLEADEVFLKVYNCSQGFGLRSSDAGASRTLRRGHAEVVGSTTSNVGLSAHSNLFVYDSEIYAVGTNGVALANLSGLTVPVWRSTLQASTDAISCSLSSVTKVQQSVLVGAVFSAAGCTTWIGASQIDGAAVGSGLYICAGAYSGGFAPLSPTCT